MGESVGEVIDFLVEKKTEGEVNEGRGETVDGLIEMVAESELCEFGR
jgi:hypothetical protein